MFTIRQILRLYASGKGPKFIGKSTGIARNTVKKYMYRYVLSGKSLEQIEKMSDAEMSHLFLIKEPLRVINKRVSDLEQMLPQYAAILKGRGVTNGKGFEVYAAKYPDWFKHVQKLLNERPRKTLVWLTPKERFRELLLR